MLIVSFKLVTNWADSLYRWKRRLWEGNRSCLFNSYTELMAGGKMNIILLSLGIGGDRSAVERRREVVACHKFLSAREGIGQPSKLAPYLSCVRPKSATSGFDPATSGM